jgi:hypothetical protein
VYAVEVGDMYFEVEALHGVLMPFSERHMKGQGIPIGIACAKSGDPVSEAASEIFVSQCPQGDQHNGGHQSFMQDSSGPSHCAGINRSSVGRNRAQGNDIEVGVAKLEIEMKQIGGSGGLKSEDLQPITKASGNISRNSSLFSRFSAEFNRLEEEGSAAGGNTNLVKRKPSILQRASSIFTKPEKPVFSIEKLEADVRALMVAQRLHVKLSNSIQIR